MIKEDEALREHPITAAITGDRSGGNFLLLAMVNRLLWSGNAGNERSFANSDSNITQASRRFTHVCQKPMSGIQVELPDHVPSKSQSSNVRLLPDDPAIILGQSLMPEGENRRNRRIRPNQAAAFDASLSIWLPNRYYPWVRSVRRFLVDRRRFEYE